MTTLDKQALEKVKDVAEGWEGSSARWIAEQAVKAYLAALPPATEAWGIKLKHTGGVKTGAWAIEDFARQWCEEFHGDTPCRVEIREVRQP